MCLICLLHLQAMFNLQMNLSSYVSCFHLMELLLFVAVIITYDIYLSYMPDLFRIKIFNIFKYVKSMSLISLNLQHCCPSLLEYKRGRPYEASSGGGPDRSA
jgi:hypothetical protein